MQWLYRFLIPDESLSVTSSPNRCVFFDLALCTRDHRHMFAEWDDRMNLARRE